MVKSIEIEAIATILISFNAHVIILFISEVRILLLIDWSCDPSPRTILLTIEFIIVIVIGACSPNSFELMSF
jgi:hypothetical protein